MVQYGFRWYRWIAMLIIKRRPLFLVSQTLFFFYWTTYLMCFLPVSFKAHPTLPFLDFKVQSFFQTLSYIAFSFFDLIPSFNKALHRSGNVFFPRSTRFTFMLTKVGCDEPGGQTIAVLLQLGNKNTNYNILNPLVAKIIQKQKPTISNWNG